MIVPRRWFRPERPGIPSEWAIVDGALSGLVISLVLIGLGAWLL